MFCPQLIVTDLDGTALRNDHTISLKTSQAFSKCYAAGIPIAIATARSFREIPAYLTQLCADYQILFDGTMIYTTITGNSASGTSKKLSVTHSANSPKAAVSHKLMTKTLSKDKIACKLSRFSSGMASQTVAKSNLTSTSFSCDTPQLLYSHTMSQATTQSLLQQFIEKGYLSHITIPTIHGIFRFPAQTETRFLSTEIPKYPVQPDSSTNFSLSLETVFPYPANKMIVSLPSEQEAARIADKCSCDYFGYRGEDRFTFYAKGAGKADAVSQLANQLHISLDNVLAFGDDRNDMEMLRLCGCGVAMGNSLPEVKKAANIITTSHEEDGIAAVLNSLFF